MDVGDHTQGGHRGTGGDLKAGGGHTRVDSGHRTQGGQCGEAESKDEVDLPDVLP